MCIAAPGKVIKIEGKKALVEYSGEIINQALIGNEKIRIGSYVLVQMGIIIDVLSRKQANLRIKAF
jgi:hydrogenase expression/formation protein HypC